MPKPTIGGTGTESSATSPAPLEERRVYFKGAGWLTCPVYWREALPAGTQLVGPAIVEELGCTTLLEPDQQLSVDEYGILAIKL